MLDATPIVSFFEQLTDCGVLQEMVHEGKAGTRSPCDRIGKGIVVRFEGYELQLVRQIQQNESGL
jgi:hypothetical protein